MQQSDNKKIATILLRKSLLSSLSRVYKHHNIAWDADLGIDRPHRVLMGNTMIQVLICKVWDQQDHSKEDVWASCDRRQKTMITMGKSSWDGEVFGVVDPHGTFNLQSTCNIELLDAYVGEVQHQFWVDVKLTPPLTPPPTSPGSSQVYTMLLTAWEYSNPGTLTSETWPRNVTGSCTCSTTIT